MNTNSNLKLEKIGHLVKQVFGGLDSPIGGQGSKKVIKNKFDLFRTVYDCWLPIIMEHRERGIDPYFINWVDYFSPIETQAWQSIRCYGVPLYPQLPILNYFLDFGNPYFKVGLELDGKDYHDTDKDRIRDEALFNAGWKIFRISGSEMMNLRYKTPCELHEDYRIDEEEREHEIRHWIMNTGDGIIAAMSYVYFNRSLIPERHESTAYKSLENHRLANFEIKDDPYVGV